MIKKREINKYDIKNSATTATNNLGTLLVYGWMSEMRLKDLLIL